MDKMREEFEAWHIEQCKADGMDLPVSSARMVGGVGKEC